MLSLRYFEDIDSILSKTGDPFIEIKDVYQQLIVRSLLNEDKPKQIEYIGKLIYYDSILSTGQEDILNKATISYDIPYFKHQKKKTEEQLKAKSRYISYAGILAGFSVLSGFVFYVRTRRMRTRLNLLLEKGPIIQSIAPVKILRPPSPVPEAIRIDILKKLELNYYRRFRRSELSKVFRLLRIQVIKWAKKRYKLYRTRLNQAYQWLDQVRKTVSLSILSLEVGIFLLNWF